MTRDPKRILSLHDEVATAIRLLARGLHELKSISGANDFYYLPFLLLATGLERLGKCIYCFHVLETTGSFPTSRRDFPAGKNGHDVEELLKWIADTLFDDQYLTRPAAKEDFHLMRHDPLLAQIVQVLSDFGQSARYYHLNVVLGDRAALKDPEQIWQALELNLLEDETDWATLLASGRLDEAYGIINERLVVPIQKLARALCRLFTLGPLGNEARRVMPQLHPFLTLRDDEFGKVEYSI